MTPLTDAIPISPTWWALYKNNAKLDKINDIKIYHRIFSLFSVLNYVQYLLYAHLALYPEPWLGKMSDVLFCF